MGCPEAPVGIVGRLAPANKRRPHPPCGAGPSDKVLHMADVTDKDIEDTLRAAGVSGGVPEHLGIDKDEAATLKAAGVNLSKIHEPAPKTEIPEPAPEGLPPADRAYVEQGKKAFRQSPVGYMLPVAEGVPALGPAIRNTAAAVSAAVPGMGLEGDTFNERFGRNERAARTATEEHIASLPPGYIIPAELAGGAMAMGPMAATRVGQFALGMRGSSLGSRSYWGAGGGAGISALDALSRGENPFFAGMVGGTTGLMGPSLGEAGRKMGSVVSERMWPRPGALKDVSPVNVNRLTGVLEAETPASLDAARRQMGPTGFFSDLTPETTTMAQGLSFGENPTAKAGVREPYRIRHAQQADEMKAVLDKTIGPKMDDVHWEKNTEDYHKKIYSPLYQAWEKTKVQPTDKLKALIPRLEKAGAFTRAEELSGISGEPINTAFFTPGSTKEYPTAKSWQYVKQGLNSKIDAAYTAGDKTLAGTLINLKKDLTKELYATKAGKLLQTADETFSGMKNIQEQHAMGRDTFVGGRNGQTVDQLRDELKTLTQVEQAARIQGLRSIADEAMGATIIGDTSLRNKVLAPNNQEKIRMMLGKKDGDELIDRMKSLKYLGDQKQTVMGGSQTESNRSAVQALQPAPAQPWDINIAQPMSIVPPGIREGLRPTNVMEAWRKQRYGDADNQLAGLLTTPEGPQLDLLLKALTSEARRRSQTKAGVDAFGNALSGMLALPAPTTARRQIPQ